MRLKISPIEALKKIDKLVKSGAQILNYIRGDAWDFHKNHILTQGVYLDEEDHNLKPKPLNTEETELYASKYDKWVKSCKEELELIFLDYTPIYKFINAFDDSEIQVGQQDRPYLLWERNIEAKLEVLSSFFDGLNSFVRSPLSYLSDRAQICFYDLICQLTPDTNESMLCNYMFKELSVGESVDFVKIYAEIKGEDVELQPEWPNTWKKTVDTAYNEINRKTNKSFGFSIFEKKKNMLFIKLPSRLISSFK